MKYLKIGKHELCAITIIAFSAGLRILLIALNWPPTNSDEGIMGIIAFHIAYHGEHPWIFYGQNYMGTLEAYMGALFFHLFGGPSLFALRLGVVLLITGFFTCMYLLTSLLFSKKLALVVLALLSIGSIPYLTRQTLATGGTGETLFFGTLSLLLVTWLTLNYHRYIPLRMQVRRLALYFCLGLVIGLAMWSDMVVAPLLAAAGLLLLIFCWRDAILAILGLAPGFLIGFLPDLRYSALHHLNPIKTLFSLFNGLDAHPPTTLIGYLHDIKETILVSIPTATSNPFCPVQELSWLSDNTPRTATCEVIRGTWGFGYLILLALALILALIALWRLLPRSNARTRMEPDELHTTRVRYTARVLLLLMGGGAILAFGLSSAPVMWPAFHARYLITLLPILPAVIEPLWNAATKIKPVLTSDRIKQLASRGILIACSLIMLTGTFIAFSELPAARSSTANYIALDNHLIQLGVKNVKSDYWSCYNITFLSNERLPCDVMTGDLKPGYNRPPTYNAIIMADPHAAYVIIPGSGQYPTFQQFVSKRSKHSQYYQFNGYAIYIP